MKPRFSKRDKFILAVGVLLLLVFIGYAQLYQLMPLRSELTSKQAELTSEQKLLDILSQKAAGNGAATIENTRELQQKVPVKPLQDQFILDMQKAETISNSEIKSMSFSTEGQVNSDPNEKSGEAASQTDSNQQPVISTPTSLKKLTVNLTVESPGYEEFEQFIDTVESLKRIVIVESINYSGGQEITNLGQENQPLSYTLTISAYYMPDLADLQAQLPKIDSPAPANKKNPLTQFPDTTNAN